MSLELAPPEKSRSLYHVTYWRRLDSIDARGLIVGASRSIGAGGYDGHVKGKIFLSEPGGVFFWYSRAQDFAEANSDDVWKDRLVPVVLRVGVSHRVERGRAVLDSLGTGDALANAWETTRTIPSSRLTVFNGLAFVPLRRFGREHAKLAVYKDSEGYVYFRDSMPLLPPECRP